LKTFFCELEVIFCKKNEESSNPLNNADPRLILKIGDITIVIPEADHKNHVNRRIIRGLTQIKLKTRFMIYPAFQFAKN